MAAETESSASGSVVRRQRVGRDGSGGDGAAAAHEVGTGAENGGVNGLANGGTANGHNASASSEGLVRVSLVREDNTASFGFDLGRTSSGRHVILATAANSPAEGKLNAGDEIISVNRIATDHLSHHTVVRLVAKRLKADLHVRRGVPPSAHELKSIQQRTERVGCSTVSQVDELRRRSTMRLDRLAQEARQLSQPRLGNLPEQTPSTLPGAVPSKETEARSSSIVSNYNANDEIRVPSRERASSRTAAPAPRLSITVRNNMTTMTAVTLRPALDESAPSPIQTSRHSRTPNHTSSDVYTSTPAMAARSSVHNPPRITKTEGGFRQVTCRRLDGQRLGLTVTGGADTLLGGIFIKAVLPQGAGAGLLQAGDRLISVNGIGLLHSTYEHAIATLQSAGTVVDLVVQALEPEAWEALRAQIRNQARLSGNKSIALANGSVLLPLDIPLYAEPDAIFHTEGDLLALTVDENQRCRLVGGADTRLGALVVSSEEPARGFSCTARLGDRILEVDGQSVLLMDQDELKHLLLETPTPIKVVVQRLGQTQWQQLCSAVDFDVNVHGAKNLLLPLEPSLVPVPQSTTPSLYERSGTSAQLAPIREAAIETTRINDDDENDVREIVLLRDPVSNEFGISLLSAVEPSRSSVEVEGAYIVRLESNLAIQAGLRVGDHVLAIDGIDLESADAREVIRVAQRCQDRAHLLVRAAPAELKLIIAEHDTASRLRRITLAQVDRLGLGLDFMVNGEQAQEIFISKILPTGAAGVDGRLRVGDQLVAFNGKDVRLCNERMLTALADNLDEVVELVVQANDKAWEAATNQAKLSDHQTLDVLPCAWVNVNLVAVVSGSMGLSVLGGSDTHYEQIIVESVEADGPAARAGLQPGDLIAAIDDHGLLHRPHREALELLNNAARGARLTILRASDQDLLRLMERLENNFLEPYHQLEFPLGPTNNAVAKGHVLARRCRLVPNQPLGLRLGGGEGYAFPCAFILDVAANSKLASHVRKGDRILEIDGHSVLHVSHERVNHLLRNARGTLNIVVQRVGVLQMRTLFNEATQQEASTSVTMAEGTQTSMRRGRPENDAPTSAALDIITSSSQLPPTDGPLLQIPCTAAELGRVSLVGGIDTDAGALFVAAAGSGLQALDRVLAVDEHGLLDGTLAAWNTVLQKLDVSQPQHVVCVQRPNPACSEALRPLLRRIEPCANRRLRRADLPLRQGNQEITTTGDLYCVQLKGNTEQLGLNIKGGRNTAFGALFIAQVSLLSPLEETVQVGDRVLQVNGHYVDSARNDDIQSLFAQRNRLEPPSLVFQRIGPEQYDTIVQHAEDQNVARGVHDVTFPRDGSFVGVTLIADEHTPERGVYIASVHNPAAIRAGLEAGQHILQINGEDVAHNTQQDVKARLDRAGDPITLTVVQDPEGYAAVQAERPHAVGAVTKTASTASARGDDVRTVHLYRAPNQSYGLQLLGEDEAGSIYIAELLPGGVAAQSGQLQQGDRLVGVNDHDTHICPQEKALQFIQELPTQVELRVQHDTRGWQAKRVSFRQQSRRDSRPSATEQASEGKQSGSVRTYLIRKQANEPFGLRFLADEEVSGPVYIDTVLPRGAIVRQSDLKSGDRLLRINGVSVEAATQSMALELIKANQEQVELQVQYDEAGYRAAKESLEDLKKEAQAPAYLTEHRIVHLERVDGSYGLKLLADQTNPSAVHIAAVQAGGAADRSGQIATGDAVVSINGVPTVSVREHEALQLIGQRPNSVDLELYSVPGAWQDARHAYNRKLSQTTSTATNHRASASARAEAPSVMLPEAGESVVDGEQEQTFRVHREDGRFRIFLTGSRDIHGCGVFINQIGNQRALREGLHEGFRVTKIDGVDVSNDTQVEMTERLRAITDKYVRLSGYYDLEGWHAIQAQAESQGPSANASKPSSISAAPIAFEQARSTPSPAAISTKHVRLERKPNESYGLVLVSDAKEPGPVYIDDIEPGGLASKSEQLREGDRVLRINGQSVESALESTAISLVRQFPDHVSLTLQPTDGAWRSARQSMHGDSVFASRRTSRADGPSPMSPLPTHEEREELSEQPNRQNDGDRTSDAADADRAIEPIVVQPDYITTNRKTIMVPRQGGRLGFKVLGHMGTQGQGVYVSEVTADSAKEAGLEPGMRIYAINDQLTENASQTEVLAILRRVVDYARMTVAFDPEGYQAYAQREASNLSVREESSHRSTPLGTRTTNTPRGSQSGDASAEAGFDVKVPRVGGKLGLVIAGQRDGVFISEVKTDEARQRGVEPGMQILAICGEDCRRLTHPEVLAKLRATTGPEVPMRLSRSAAYYQLIASAGDREITIVNNGRGFGIDLLMTTDGEEAVYVSALTQDGAAKATGFVHVGDRVLTVNGRSVASCTNEDVLALLVINPNAVKLTLRADIENYERLSRRLEGQLQRVNLDAMEEKDFLVQDVSKLGVVRTVTLHKQNNQLGCGLTRKGELDGFFFNKVAERHGDLVQPGDRIVAVDGQNLLELDVEAKDVLAAAGSAVRVTILRVNLKKRSKKGPHMAGFDLRLIGEVLHIDVPPHALDNLRLVYIPHSSEAQHFVQHEDLGIHEGDRLLAVNGELVLNNQLTEILRLCSTSESTRLTIYRLHPDLHQQAFSVDAENTRRGARFRSLRSKQRRTESTISKSRPLGSLRRQASQAPSRGSGEYENRLVSPAASDVEGARKKTGNVRRGVTIERGQQGFGFTIRAPSGSPGHLIVGSVTAGGPAATEGTLRSGSRIFSINGHDTTTVTRGWYLYQRGSGFYI
ncbi:uncharacterized protein MONBRDRAFT_38169 [Monosiga brevicollis MX1]|uniref:PDZ domain-containing protein n=1 Tax=Monosiga brevicollis TaxID=81824 RepID=A9V625_MONBE|nr:uncharacterized protein MONBRDRAFT_38169 [Monosiga brevicollis MX1]EDQ86913.1 predicted protein [Monosiga brevicollis MX1]|eukprot:XP_001748152.1 hypothetical protein [Monosiga brevicollis MX1]